MKFSTSLLIAAVAAPSVSSFAPASSAGSSTVLKAAGVADDVEPPAPPPLGPTLNGWTPDASKDCFGLPGAISPLGYFDPLGFCKERSLLGVKRFREAEIMHGRVAMMATLGYLIAENTPTIAFGFEHPTIANNMIPEVTLGVMFPFFLAINISEALRANKGWVEPGMGELFTLREGYYPGDLGFDPLGLKPAGAKDFADMQAKELSNGRLAMFAVAGMCAQELINGQPVLADIALPF
jgi:hypothetical protein